MIFVADEVWQKPQTQATTTLKKTPTVPTISYWSSDPMLLSVALLAVYGATHFAEDNCHFEVKG